MAKIQKFCLADSLLDSPMATWLTMGISDYVIDASTVLYQCSLCFMYLLAGLPGFARDSHTTIMSICAFHFYIIYFHFFSADHGIPQTFDDILTI